MKDTDRSESQPLSERGSNRSQRPTSAAFRRFIASGWAEREEVLPEEIPAAPYAAARRARVGAQFPGGRLVVPAGPLRTRSTGTDHRFRPHSAFPHPTRQGTDQGPGALLVPHPSEG